MAQLSNTYESVEWLYNHATTIAEGGTRPSCMITGVQDLPSQINDMRAQARVQLGRGVRGRLPDCGVPAGIRRGRRLNLGRLQTALV